MKNKYQEALDFLIINLNDEWFDWAELEEKWEHIDNIQELVDKATLDYLNRKDKLVVCSEWVCEVDCYHRYGEHDSGNIVLVSELVGGDVRYSNSKEHLCEMTIDQFLACFIPVEKENV